MIRYFKQLSLIIIICLSYTSYAQVGINIDNPKATLHIHNPDPNNPSPTTGLIIPRVNQLNITDEKEIGLMVFLDSNSNSDKGFYWWDGSDWNPFVSTNKTIVNNSIVYASTATVFREGNITNANSNTRTLDFNFLKTLDNLNFNIDNGELIITKPGYYYLKSVAYIRKIGGETDRRDQLDLKIFVNGSDASASDSFNFNIQGSNSFPVGLVPISINAAGTIKLNANDRISMKIVRSYADPSSNSTIIAPDPNAKSNIILNYLGDF